MRPGIISVGDEPLPMDSPPSSNGRHRHRGRSMPKGKHTAAGRFRTLNAFVDFTLAELGRAEIAVWLILFRDSRDGIARTGQSDIARRAAINRRTVYRALRRLEGRGLVRVVRRGRLGAGPSSYRLRWLAADMGT